jgi:hypothetical protein
MKNKMKNDGTAKFKTQQCLQTDIEIGEFNLTVDNYRPEDDLSSIYSHFEAFEEDLEKGEDIKIHIDDIILKEELTSDLDISINKWRKFWRQNRVKSKTKF